MARWVWDSTKEKALNLIFAGRLPLDKVALSCAVPARTLDHWIAHANFQQRLEAKRADLAAALATVTYADKTRRIIALNEMAEQARLEFEAHPLLREIRPLPPRQGVKVKMADGGDEHAGELPDAIVNESFNRDAFESFRGALDDIAKELGQRKTGNETTVNVNQQQVMFVLPEVLNDDGQAQVIYDIPAIEPTEDDH